MMLDDLREPIAKALADASGYAGFPDAPNSNIFREMADVVIALLKARLPTLSDDNPFDGIELYETNDPWAPGGSDRHYFVRYGTNLAATDEIPVEIYERIDAARTRLSPPSSEETK